MTASYRFQHAIVRQPGESVAEGLRAVDTGDPEAERFNVEHQAYIQALETAGVGVHVLPPLEHFPDSVFIEDTALCLPDGAVIMRPGAPSRAGETEAMGGVLSALYNDVRLIDNDGFIEGGDILVSEREIIVGLSDRTDPAGAAALTTCVSDWGHTVRVLQTPPEILHFKTASSLLDDETVLVTRDMAATGFFEAYRSLVVPDGEDGAANAIRVNDHVFVSDGFPETADLIDQAGYQVVVLGTFQAAKVDGGLSCMSLRF